MLALGEAVRPRLVLARGSLCRGSLASVMHLMCLQCWLCSRPRVEIPTL